MGVSGTRSETISRALTALILVVSLILSLAALIGRDPTAVTLSAVGRADRPWFFAWGISTAIAVYTNVRLLAGRLDLHWTLLGWPLIVGCVAVVVCVAVVGDSWWQSSLHWTSGIVFGVVSYVTLFGVLRARDVGPWAPLVVFLAVAAVLDVTTIFVWGLTALCEITILVACEVALLSANFLAPSRHMSGHRVNRPINQH